MFTSVLRNTGIGALALGLVMFAATPQVFARGKMVYPSDLMDTSVYPGMRGILELDGDNIHNCGNVLLHITNFGLIGSAPGSGFTFNTAPSAQWPAGSPTEYLWVGGLWIAAEKNAEKVVTTAVYQLEFRPGLTELDRIYRTRELAPGGARIPSPNADDDRDGQMDEDRLNGVDDDGDGLIDEDFAAISNQMFFCEYRDSDPNIKLAQPDHEPLNFLVQQSSLCWEDDIVDDFIAFDFTLINEGFDPLLNVYVGFFADCDIGPREAEQVAEDDYAGFWEGVKTARLGNSTKNVKVSVGYMWDDDTDEGQSEGYIGLMFLGATDPSSDGAPGFVSLRNFRMFAGTASFEQGGDPTNDEQRYATMDGTAPKSLGLPDATGARPPQIAKKKDDYRMLVSAGPFEQVDPGDTLTFQAALVLGRFFEGMVDNAVQAQLTYDGVYVDYDENLTTGVDGRETPVCADPFAGQTFRINPCDEACDNAQGDPNCYVTVPNTGCEWINADCEYEEFTEQRTGVDGKETQVHWLIGTAPPPPKMRLVASEGQVDILWDNFSEITPDLRLNVIDFESYRIWRADNWQRPYGSDINTGPGSDLWMLLAEFDLPKNKIGSDTGLESIRYEPNIPSGAIEFYREWFEAHPFLQPPDVPGFTADELDTAKALARGVRYYKYTDPPFIPGGYVSNVPCPSSGVCPPLEKVFEGKTLVVSARCNNDGYCAETAPSPHSGAHYFYAVSASDHKVELDAATGLYKVVGPGLAGDPNSNFVYINPPTNALVEARAGEAQDEIYVVPNPATEQSMRAWTLQPNNDDPTGVKVEFHHLPQSRGLVTVYTLSGDMVVELPFDGSNGAGSLAWDLLSRNGQEITSGVYLFSVEADKADFKRFVGKFVVIR
jgi:hypothetical protein